MGTVYQLRNLLNRRNVTKSPKENVNAAEDFLDIITAGHILSSVMSYLKMKSLDDLPSSAIVSHDAWMEDDSVRSKILRDISAHVVKTHVDLATIFKQPSTSVETGTVYDYACEVLSLGLLVMDFKDAVREGDGKIVVSLLWKYMMLLFKASGRKNYAIEALTLLSQYELLLPPNVAEQLQWSRFINVRGLPGHNISCDLHMEHINRLVKVAIDGLGANKSKKAIKRAGKAAIGVLSEAMESYDIEVGIKPPSGKHSKAETSKDLEKVVNQLMECDVFVYTTKAHSSFSQLKTNLIKTLEEDKLKDWMVERFSILLQPDFSPEINTDSDCSL